MKALTSDELRGVWAALPTPWSADGRIDAGLLEENVRRYKERGIHGVYTTDSDGEFYAIEIDQFRELAKIFGRAVATASLPAAMGVTWSHTAGIADRIRASLDAGIPNVHVAFPFWMPLAKPDVPRFFEDLARAAPEARWIHYRTPRGHILPSGREYARYQQTFPNQFIGTKLGSTDITEIIEIIAHAPALTHFAVEYTAVPAALAGARGVYSYWVKTMPGWTLGTWRLCEEGRNLRQ
jgi:dihydrodipicolinate synthase/N-acetylneuraminate lyase